MTRVALALLLLFLVTAAGAAEFRWPCERVFTWFAQSRSSGLNKCEVVLNGRTGYARIYLPEPGTKGLYVGIVALWLLGKWQKDRG